MKVLSIILLAALALALILFASGFKDIQRYREMRAM